ncbi:TPA: hypothetical protein ENS27_00310 [bacterium]|nr:hypothetical protein [bacterium]
MAIFEVDRDKMMEIFNLKQNVKSSVLAVMDNRLTAAHLATDVYALIELLEKLEIELVGAPLVQEIPQPVETPAQPEETPAQQPEQEQQPESQPQEQPQSEQA